MNGELTSREAADILNVSEGYVAGLVRSGQILGREVESKYVVSAASLHEYGRCAKEAQKAAADELAALSQEMRLV